VELVSARGATQLLGCRRDAGWRLLLSSCAASASPDGVYRPASGPSPALDAAIDELIEGVPLDATAERDVMSRGWRANGQ
jgi:hypothetical protein